MTEPDRLRVAHVVPAMFIGGVEVAIDRSHRDLNKVIDYRVYYVRKRGSLDCDQRHVLKLLWTCMTGSWRPGVVVTSLWWSHPFGALLRRFGVTWMAFFHNCGFTGAFQRAILQFAWRNANTRLVDSQATGEFYRDIIERDYRVIPYIFPEQPKAADWRSRHYDFVWVGRRVAAKRADLVAAFMRRIADKQSEGSLCLIVSGEVPPEVATLDLGPGWTVSVRQSLDGGSVRDLLADSRFFLLTSDFEGMSMATVEAIFAGCVPVVRLVGELKNYIGSDHVLAISDGSAPALEKVASRVMEYWEDEAFAAATLERIKGRIASYSSYEHEFLSAVTNARGNVSA